MKKYIIVILVGLTLKVLGQTVEKTEIDTVFSESGKIETITYKTNGLKDKVITYYEGSITNELNFKNGIREGLSINYNHLNRGKVRMKMMYKEGRPNGLSETYNDSGKIISTGYYDNGLQIGLWTAYYENGNKCSITDYKTGKGEWVEVIYYKNGNQSSEMSYAGKDYQDFAFKYYYENGNLKYRGMIKEGKMFGERLCYNEDGKPCTGNFVNYTEDGLIEKECKCINGRPEGEMKVYNGGTLTYTVNFKNGKPDGFKTFINGLKKELYKNGIFIKEIKKGMSTPPM